MEKRVGSAAAAHFLTKNNVQNMIDQINQQRAGQGQGPFQWKTIPQEAATSVWAAVVGPSDMIVRNDLPVAINEGVRGCAIDPNAAEALWKKSEEMLGESFYRSELRVIDEERKATYEPVLCGDQFSKN